LPGPCYSPRRWEEKTAQGEAQGQGLGQAPGRVGKGFFSPCYRFKKGTIAGPAERPQQFPGRRGPRPNFCLVTRGRQARWRRSSLGETGDPQRCLRPGLVDVIIFRKRTRARSGRGNGNSGARGPFQGKKKKKAAIGGLGPVGPRAGRGTARRGFTRFSPAPPWWRDAKGLSGRCDLSPDFGADGAGERGGGGRDFSPRGPPEKCSSPRHARKVPAAFPGGPTVGDGEGPGLGPKSRMSGGFRNSPDERNLRISRRPKKKTTGPFRDFSWAGIGWAARRRFKPVSSREWSEKKKKNGRGRADSLRGLKGPEAYEG